MATRTTAAPTQLEQLAAEFAPGEHKSRRQGSQDLTYVTIDATIRRLNEVLGPNWSTSATTEVTPLDGKFTAVCQLNLNANIDGIPKTAYGVGAMVNGDPDMAAKTALAEAIKKAGHQLGIALYLWDADARARVESKRKLSTASSASLKQEVFKIAKERLGKDAPTAAEIAKEFNVKPGALADGATLREILVKEGLL